MTLSFFFKGRCRTGPDTGRIIPQTHGAQDARMHHAPQLSICFRACSRMHRCSARREPVGRSCNVLETLCTTWQMVLARDQEFVELWARTMTAGQSAVTSGPSRFVHATAAVLRRDIDHPSYTRAKYYLHCKSGLLAMKAFASDTLSHCNSAWRYHLYFFYLRISIKFPCHCF